jgi:hypothetical protein
MIQPSDRRKSKLTLQQQGRCRFEANQSNRSQDSLSINHTVFDPDQGVRQMHVAGCILFAPEVHGGGRSVQTAPT